jgi:hypothetical protein
VDDLFDFLLNTLIEYARKRRNKAHDSLASLERKRSLATVVTKLEEAQMWNERAEREKGTDP